MRQYETVIIIDADQTEEQIKNLIQKTKETIEKHSAKVLQEFQWGRRRLAYEIRKKKYGVYYVLYLEGESNLLEELNRFFKIEESVLRFQSVKIETSIEEEASFFSSLISSKDDSEERKVETKQKIA